MIACSSWTFGSAFSSNFPVSAAVRYFQVRLMSLNMARTLRPAEATPESFDLFGAKCDHGHKEDRQADADADGGPDDGPTRFVGPDPARHHDDGGCHRRARGAHLAHRQEQSSST